MNMTDLDTFLPGVLPYAPGCAVPTAYFGIRQAAIELCERTRLWRHELSAAVGEDGALTISAPVGSVVHGIEHARFAGQPLEPVAVAWLDRHQTGWREGALTGQSRYLAQLEPGTVRLVPAQAGTLDLALWLKPSQDCSELPAFIADHYRTLVAHGALAHILSMPGEVFSNPGMAGASSSIFQARLDALAYASSTGQQRARVRTRPSFF